MITFIKKFLRSIGLDVIKHRPVYETTISPLGITTVIDIGANTGAYSKDARSRYPDAVIYAFEPITSCFQELQSTMAGDQKFKAFQCALGESQSTTVIHKNAFHPSSSLLTMTNLHKELYPKTAQSSEETIGVRRLDDVMEPIRLNGNILIKMDVQGFEDKVIVGGPKTFAKAAAVVIETSFVPLYEGQPLFNDICKMMADLGFSYRGDAGRHYNTTTHKLIYEDSVFIRKDLVTA